MFLRSWSCRHGETGRESSIAGVGLRGGGRSEEELISVLLLLSFYLNSERDTIYLDDVQHLLFLSLIPPPHPFLPPGYSAFGGVYLLYLYTNSGPPHCPESMI